MFDIAEAHKLAAIALDDLRAVPQNLRRRVLATGAHHAAAGVARGAAEMALAASSDAD